MSEKESKLKINTEENEKIKTQIDASIGIARSLVNSWLPLPKKGEKLFDDEEDELTMQKYSTGRPDRLGLGAKFLSHNEAMRHNNDNASVSKEQLLLKNKILNQNRKAANYREAPTPIGKRFRPDQQQSDSDDDDEESRSTTVGVKAKAKKKKHNNNTMAKDDGTAAATATNSGSNKKIGSQGDFLSMYLSERAGKKKKKSNK